MLDYLIRRLTGTIPVLLAVSAFVFLFVHLLPGDPARLAAGPDATPQDIAAVRADMGLDRPLLAQFLRYLGQTVQLQSRPLDQDAPAGGGTDRRTLHADVAADRVGHAVVGDRRHRRSACCPA